ncbi:FkbM family methyltransferase [Caldichromatium japonicum]|uniref:FkbM family methyltransferase n=1 Tax=Caldichromatium japonicum TaxID=2699430 RepID=A0A6G7VEU8_9GAMM|nr:FkbM family methyltransferase [Caldichromatium japonicum]QIK38603.1 FkbM family methyltransferase [Caldichromatium japonicum]
MKYYSQHGQDQYLHKTLFPNRRDGFFIEFGALDGLLDSNTLFFEQQLGWSGILIEPNPDAFALLKRHRPACQLENIAISDENGMLPFIKIAGNFYGWSGLECNLEPQHRQRIEQYIQPQEIHRIMVEVHDLYWLVDKYGLTHVDLISIDTEGTEERIMRAFPWQRLTVSVFCIENNFDNYNISDLMANHGYIKTARIGTDDIFVHRSLMPSGR